MPEIEAIINNSIANLDGGDGGDGGDSGENALAGTGDAIDTGDGGQGDSGGDQAAAGDSGTSGSASGDGTGAAQPTAEELAAQQAAEEAFAKEYGLAMPKPGQRENRIPYSRVKTIIQNAIDKRNQAIAEAAWGKKYEGKDFDADFKAHVGRIPEIEQKLTSYEAEFKNMDVVGKIMAEQPDRFIEMLPQINPRYAELIGKAQKDAEAAMKAVREAELGPRPEPDVDLGDGRKTYSIEGHQKLAEWEAKRLKADLEKQFEEKFKPVTERIKGEQTLASVRKRADEIVNEARRDLPGFKEAETDILKLVAEKDMMPATAHAHVMAQKHTEALAAKDKEIADLKTSREQMRKEILAEIAKAPNSTSVAGGGGGSRVPAGSGDPITDAINRSIANKLK